MASSTDKNRNKQNRLIFGLFTGYAFYSLLRKSFAVSVPFMRTSMDLSKADVGNIATSFSAAYGISKFVGGVVSDFLPPDALFAIGLFLAALSNFLFSFSTSTTMLCVLWFLNGSVQGKYYQSDLVDLFPLLSLPQKSVKCSLSHTLAYKFLLLIISCTDEFLFLL